MRKAVAVIGASTALFFGGAGVANATIDQVPAPASSTTTLADTTNNTNDDQHSDKTGLWGLAGLLGLAGLAGLRRRNTNLTAQPTVNQPTVSRGPTV